MFGRRITGLIVVGLAVGVWALWPREDTSATSTTSLPTELTTTTMRSTTTSNEVTSTSGSVESSDVIETVEAAEEVLRDFWFGWFEGIYNQDEDRIREVVASQNLLDNARNLFGDMEFLAPPDRSTLTLSMTEILQSTPSCTVIWSEVDVPFRGGVTSGTHVLRRVEHGWATVSVWANRDDLWEQDCAAQLEPLQ